MYLQVGGTEHCKCIFYRNANLYKFQKDYSKMWVSENLGHLLQSQHLSEHTAVISRKEQEIVNLLQL